MQQAVVKMGQAIGPNVGLEMGVHMVVDLDKCLLQQFRYLFVFKKCAKN